MNFTAFYKILMYISLASVLVPIASCFLRFKALNLILRALFIFLVTAFIIEITEQYILNFILQDVYTIVECSFVVFIYYQVFENKKTKILISLFYILFLALAIFRFIIQEGYKSSDSVVNTYEAIFILILGWAYLFKLMKELKIYDLREHYFFWLNFAFVLYFSMAFVLFLFYHYLEKLPMVFYQYLWGMHLVINITSNILISRGIWKAQPR